MKRPSGRDQIISEIKQFSRRYQQNNIVLTCRIAAVEYNFDQFAHVEMADFSPEQIERFISNWFQNDAATGQMMWAQLQAKEHKGIRELTRNPLLLTLLCLAYQETLHFPKRRVEIYEEALEVLLKKWDSTRGIRRDSGLWSAFPGTKAADAGSNWV